MSNQPSTEDRLANKHRHELLQKLERLADYRQRWDELDVEEAQQSLDLRRDVTIHLHEYERRLLQASQALSSSLDDLLRLQTSLTYLAGQKNPDPRALHAIVMPLVDPAFDSLSEALNQWRRIRPTPLEQEESEEFDTPDSEMPAAEFQVPAEADEPQATADALPSDPSIGTDLPNVPGDDSQVVISDDPGPESISDTTIDLEDAAKPDPKVATSHLEPEALVDTETASSALINRFRHPPAGEYQLRSSLEQIPEEWASLIRPVAVAPQEWLDPIDREVLSDVDTQALVNQVIPAVIRDLRHWTTLPRAALMLNWLEEQGPEHARLLPTAELVETAFLAFRPTKQQDGLALNLEPVQRTLLEATVTERKPSAWMIAAELYLIKAHSGIADDLLLTGWSLETEFEPWREFAQTIVEYVNSTSLPFAEAFARLAPVQTATSREGDRKQALETIAALTRTARFDFSKGKRLASSMANHFAELRRSLEKNEPTVNHYHWAVGFDPPTRVQQWSQQIKPAQVAIQGRALQVFLRDLYKLQHHVQQWAEPLPDASVSKGAGGEPQRSLRNLAQALQAHRVEWTQAWTTGAAQWPTLSAWSLALLDDLTTATQPVLSL